MPRRVVLFALIAVISASLSCRRATSSAVDVVEREAQDLFVQYLRIDTTNPPGNETAGARFLQQVLIKDGIDAKLVGSDPKRQAVYARLSSGTNEKSLLLLHHIDVVPVVAAEWTKPPFAGLRANGYIWGRGALDIKSLGIAELMAVLELKRRKLPLTRDVVYLAVPDEELGGLHGAKELLDTHPELFANVGYVLNEGGYNETIVDKVSFWGIEVQQKVPLFLRVTLHGWPGHARTRLGGGACTNCLPATGTADLDIRLLPDEKSDAMEARVRELVGKNGEVAVILAGEPSPESPSDTDLFRLLAATFQKSEPGSAVA